MLLPSVQLLLLWCLLLLTECHGEVFAMGYLHLLFRSTLPENLQGVYHW